LEEVAGLLRGGGARDPGLELPEVGARQDAVVLDLGHRESTCLEDEQDGVGFPLDLAFSLASAEVLLGEGCARAMRWMS